MGKSKSATAHVAKLRSQLVESISSSASAEQALKQQAAMVEVWDFMQKNPEQVSSIRDAVVAHAFAPPDPSAGMCFEKESHRYFLKLPREYVIAILKLMHEDLVVENLRKLFSGDRYLAHKLLYLSCRVDATTPVAVLNKVELCQWLLARCSSLGLASWPEPLKFIEIKAVDWNHVGVYALLPAVADGVDVDKHVFTEGEVRGVGTFPLPPHLKVTAAWTLKENWGIQTAIIVPPGNAKMKLKLYDAVKETPGLADFCKKVQDKSVENYGEPTTQIQSALRPFLGARGATSASSPPATHSPAITSTPSKRSRGSISGGTEAESGGPSPRRLSFLSPSQVQQRLQKIRRQASSMSVESAADKS
eukprot:6478762-Amphidinium_carterae.2